MSCWRKEGQVGHISCATLEGNFDAVGTQAAVLAGFAATVLAEIHKQNETTVKTTVRAPHEDPHGPLFPRFVSCVLYNYESFFLNVQSPSWILGQSTTQVTLLGRHCAMRQLPIFWHAGSM